MGFGDQLSGSWELSQWVCEMKSFGLENQLVSLGDKVNRIVQSSQLVWRIEFGGLRNHFCWYGDNVSGLAG